MASFDDFLENAKSAGQDFVNDSIGVVFEDIGLNSPVLGKPAQNQNTDDIKRDSPNSTVPNRNVADKGLLKNVPWPTGGSAMNMLPFVFIGGAILLAVLLRRKK